MMNGFDSLMEEISYELDIPREPDEAVTSWYGRIILSVVSRTGQAALWDVEEADDSCSLVHYHRRMEHILESYFKMFPAVENDFSLSDSENTLSQIVEYIDFLNTKTGNLYHSERHVHPVMPRAAGLGAVTLTRGLSIDEPQYVSGMGTYLKRPVDLPLEDPVEMYQLHRGNMKDEWNSIISTLSGWKDLGNETDIEYMNLNTSSRNIKVWDKRPDRSGEISLARMNVGPKQYWYYFYFYENGKFQYKRLEAHREEDEAYLRNACLYSMNRLPEITVEDRGRDVLLKFRYVLPKAERYLVKFYSWGPMISNFNSNFNRIMNRDVFNGIRKILESEGYVFVSQ